MQATAKLIAAIQNGSIKAFAISDGNTPGRPLYSLGGLDSAYVIDAVNLTIQPSQAGYAPCKAIAVEIPKWLGTAAVYLNLSAPGLYASTADLAAATAMANAGYLA